MAIPQAKQLLQRVEKGETLTAEERRHVIGYLMTVEPERAGTAELSELFKMPDSSIRRDKRMIKEELANALKNEDFALNILADVDTIFQNTFRELEKGKKTNEVGSRLWLDHVKEIKSTIIQYAELLQSLGMVPKNLGTHTEKKFVFKATVEKDGSVQVRDSATIDAEIVDPEEEARRRLDEEFSSKPQLPPAPVDGERTDDSSSVRTVESVPTR